MNLGAIVSDAIKAVPGGLRTTVVVGRVRPGALDPATNTRTGDAQQTFSVRTVVLTPKAEAGQTQVEKARALLIAAADCTFVPEPGHYVTALAPEPSTKWRVLRVLPVGPNGSPALLRVEVER